MKKNLWIMFIYLLTFLSNQILQIMISGVFACYKYGRGFGTAAAVSFFDKIQEAFFNGSTVYIYISPMTYNTEHLLLYI